MANKKASNSALIDSSFVVLYVLFVVVWAKIYADHFPPSVQAESFKLSVLFALMLLFLRYLLYQFYDAVTVLRAIFFYFCLSAGMAFLSGFRGPLVEGQIPVIHLGVFGSHFYSGAFPSLIYGSVFTFYGTVTAVCSILTASVFEFAYSVIYPYLPRSVRRSLKHADAKIDRASTKLSDHWFYQHDKEGVIAVGALMVTYTVAYVLLLFV